MRNRDNNALGSLMGAAIAAGLLGCEGSGSVPVNKTAGDLSVAICRRAYECCTAEQLMKNESAGTSVAECERYTSRDLRNLLETIQSSHDAMRARYEPDRAQACLTSLQTSSCSALNATNHLTGIPACQSFVTPLVATGGVCKHDYECIGGTCELPENAAPGASGTCVATAAVDFSSAASGATDAAAVAPAAPRDPSPAASPPSAQCFYESGCTVAGKQQFDGTGAAALLLIAGALWVRRRRA